MRRRSFSRWSSCHSRQTLPKGVFTLVVPSFAPNACGVGAQASALRTAALACAVLLAACGGAPAPGSGAVVTPTATAAPTILASPTPAGTPTPRPSPLVSQKGSIRVDQPLRGDQIGSPLTIAGEASVFEGTLRWRIVTASGNVLADGNTVASAGAPLKGTFKTEVTFALPYYGETGSVEVFEVSPKDGTISDIARVPVGITGSY